MNVTTKRKDGMYKSLAHERIIPQDLYQQNIKKLYAMMTCFDGTKFIDGLNTVDFEVTETKENSLYKRIKVKI